MVDPAHKCKTFDPITYTFDRNKRDEFLIAIGESSPAYLQEGAPLPPTIITVVSFWGGEGLESALQQIGVDIWSVLHAEQEYEFHEPFYVGDTITGRTHVADIYERKGRSGELTFVIFETAFANQHGSPVVTGRSTIVVRGG
ncbi:MAG: MaoC family dehydratase N-terminal domain-containing protein [Anaerolineae bacterium]